MRLQETGNKRQGIADRSFSAKVMNSNVLDYKDLKVWQKALEVVCDIIELVDLLPSGPASETVGKQMLGSSTSVCANIAEGHSSGTSKEYNRILRIAYREAKETDNWLQVIKTSRKFAKPRILSLAREIELKKYRSHENVERSTKDHQRLYKG